MRKNKHFTPTKLKKIKRKEKDRGIFIYVHFVKQIKMFFSIYLLFYRLKTKKNRENLEQFLMHSEKMTSLTKYYRCDEMFANLEVCLFEKN